MDMFLYLDKDTFLHRLDPRTKLFVMLSTFTVAIMFFNLPILSCLLAIVILYGMTGKTLSNLKRIRFVLFMIAMFSIVLWSLTFGGATKILGPISTEGIMYGITVAVKINIMILAGMIFLSSTKVEEISLGLVKLRLPYRGAFAFATAIRMVPMIVATSYTISQAQKSRGLDLDSGSFIERVKKYVPLLIPTFVSVIRGTNVFAMALESKGFGYSEERTNYLQISIKKGDVAVLTLVALVIVVSTYFKVFVGI